MKIALVFFGLNRSGQWTAPSIKKNIIHAIEGDQRILVKFAALNLIDSIDNPRSHEIKVKLNNDNNLGFDFDEVVYLRQDEVEIDDIVKKISSSGDFYEDDFRSVRNLLYQLNSLSEAWNLITRHRMFPFDYYFFIRPDLYYFDPVNFEEIHRNLREKRSILVPKWHSYKGCNDRFAVATHEAAIAYCARMSKVVEYSSKWPLHAERLLLYSLQEAGVKIHTLNRFRACRVRANGFFYLEDYSKSLFQRKNIFKKFIYSFFRLFSSGFSKK